MLSTKAYAVQSIGLGERGADGGLCKNWFSCETFVKNVFFDKEMLDKTIGLWYTNHGVKWGGNS